MHSKLDIFFSYLKSNYFGLNCILNKEPRLYNVFFIMVFGYVFAVGQSSDKSLTINSDEQYASLKEKPFSKDAYFFDLDIPYLSSRYGKIPSDLEIDAVPAKITLPDEKGNMSEYYILESSVLSLEMARKFPDFKTYTISGIKNKSAHGRIFLSRFGLEGMIIIDNKQVKLEPIDNNNPIKHKAYTLEAREDIICNQLSEDKVIRETGKRFALLGMTNGGSRRTYEIALVATGEFYQNANLGNNSLVTANAAIVSIINLVNIRYNVEMAIHFTIFSSPTIYTDPATDPFDPSGSNLTSQSTSAVQSNYPGGGYDLGHVLNGMSSGGSGIAGISVICGSFKSRGWSGGSGINTIALSIMIHELGHMLGAGHTFNGIGNNCSSGNLSVNSSVEIGSGTTIMSYAGSCQTDNNIQNNDDPYFHSVSIQSFLSYLSSTGGTCATNSSTGNTPPAVNANPCLGTFVIPKLTPFSIQGSATDPNLSDVLTYIWEETDEDGPGYPTQGYIGTTAGNSAIAPLFRSYPPSVSGLKRTFPAMNTILNNANQSNFEPLPNVARSINLRLIARDNNSLNGGIGSDDVVINVNGTAGPLSVTSPNTAANWSPGSQTVTWSVNNTNTLFASVDILLSLDGGNSFPITLLANTPNDGSETFVLGNYPATTNARIKVRYAPNSCFEIFDISDTNFTITSSCSVASSNICPSLPLTATYGDAALNLGLSPVYGNAISSRAMTTGGSVINVAYNLTPASPGSGNCTTGNFGYVSDSFKFRITVSGNYTFSMNSANPLSIFNGAYNFISPCSNYLGSTAYDADGNPSGSAYFTSQMTLNLSNICSDYTAVLYRQSGTNVNLSISGPVGGTIFESSVTPPVGSSYTYVAVESINNLISAVSNNSDFTTLPGGSYCVYGVSYQSALNPSTWKGLSIANLQSSGNCILSSTNCKPLNVNCTSIVTSTANSGAGTVRASFECMADGSTITYGAGVNSILTQSLIINKNITLQGSTLNTIDLNFSGLYGIKIAAGKTLTLKDIKINLIGTASPVILNEGTLILENAEIKGNVNPVINNLGAVNVVGNLPSVIKKL